MEKFVYQICAVAFLLIGLAQAAVLFADPKDVTVDVNEWAQFNCTVHCQYTVGWYMAGHSIAIRRNNAVPGLLIKRRRASRCTESDDEWTHFLEILATEAFNKSTVYCAVYKTRREEKSCSCGTDGRCYSRPALLTVRMAPTIAPPSLSTGVPDITPSPRPSPSSTSQETASPELLTMTTTVTVTVTPTPTNCPKLDPTSSSPERKSSTQAVPAPQS